MGNTQPGGFYNIVTKTCWPGKGNVQLTLGSFNLYRAAADIEKTKQRRKILGKTKPDGI